MRAHLLGGVPRAEVAAKNALFSAHGFDPMTLLVPRDGKYLDFAPGVTEKADLKAGIEADAGVKSREVALADAFEAWWATHRSRIIALPISRDLMKVRGDFLKSFQEALTPIGLLDRFKVAGAVATWWGEVQFDLKSLAARGFEGTVEGWVTTITTAMEEDGGKFDPLDHKLVKRLLAEFLDDLAEAEGAVAELDGTLKAAESLGGDGDEEDGGDGDGDDGEDALSEAEVKALKAKIGAAKKRLKALKATVAAKLKEAHATLGSQEAKELVLDLLKADLKGVVDRAVMVHRQAIVGVVENWWDKYRVTLRAIEGERDAAKARLDGFLRELGYAH